MNDENIKEIYLLCILAKNKGQENIPVHILPYRFTDLNNAIFSINFPFKDLWNILEKSYNYFNKHKLPQNFYISHSGDYILMD